jgi:restriction system protein
LGKCRGITGTDRWVVEAKARALRLEWGQHVLHFLEKHGHKAKIDIKEAKMFLAEEK